MKLLIVGSEGKGSWKMRGQQLGQALKARVVTKPASSDWAWADVVVLVKRAAFQYQRQVSALRVPVIWDALDFWDQPVENGRSEAGLVQVVEETRSALGLDLVIGATEAMARAVGGAYLPHHCRLGLKPTPPRVKAEVVGYDGQRKYLGSWLTALESACAELGMQFVVNPPDLRAVDVLVSFRDGQWDGWACRQWKSGVKYVNAIVAGRPVLTQPSAAFDELAPVGQFVESTTDLVDALRAVTAQEVREQAYAMGQQRAASFQVEAIAARYAEILQHARRRAA